jgi:hypothetical protein
MTQEALKLALPLLEDCVNSYRLKYERPAFDKAIAAIKEALAQPEQEPVAYINVEKRRLEFAEPMVWHTPTVVNLERIPLYTQQRTWVGLTDVEIDYLLGSTAGENEETHISFARAIEAKLKERNT